MYYIAEKGRTMGRVEASVQVVWPTQPISSEFNFKELFIGTFKLLKLENPLVNIYCAYVCSTFV